MFVVFRFIDGFLTEEINTLVVKNGASTAIQIFPFPVV